MKGAIRTARRPVQYRYDAANVACGYEREMEGARREETRLVNWEGHEFHSCLKDVASESAL